MTRLTLTLVAALAGAIAVAVVAPKMVILPAIAAVAAMSLMAAIVLSGPPTVRH